LAHGHAKYKLIIERDCYRPAFDAILSRATECLNHDWDTNIHVSGNPGIGKSRFYLYFIFRLLLEETTFMSKYKLLINYNDDYFLYDSKAKSFLPLNTQQVKSYQGDTTVLRLIEVKSDQLNGWSGVSVLFASPGVPDLNNFMKIESFTFYLPVWTFEEIKELNALLDEPSPENVLLERFSKFGGIPRFIFTDALLDEDNAQMQAIGSTDTLKVMSIVNQKIVQEVDYSHRILRMVPDENFRNILHLDFVSKYVAEKIVENVTSDSIHALSAFYVSTFSDDSGTTAAVRGRIYEMLCHRRIKGGLVLIFKSLCPKCHELIVTVPPKVQVFRFAKLDEITSKEIKGMVYCQPSSVTFGALDSFILDMGTRKCFGLQMNINQNHGIKHRPLCKFITWLKEMGIDFTEFYFGFVVPDYLFHDFRTQSFLNIKNTVRTQAGQLEKMKQYVVPLDAFKM